MSGCQAGCRPSCNSPLAAEDCAGSSFGVVLSPQNQPPEDLDILLTMSENFEADRMSARAQAVFDSTRAKLLFEADVFWARASIGHELLDLWLDTYQTSRSFRKRGIVELELP